MIDRIVVLNDIAKPVGGAIALALLLARLFRERGLAVTYISGDTGDNADLAAAGVEIVALGQARLEAAGMAQALVDGLFNRAAAPMTPACIAADCDRRNRAHKLWRVAPRWCNGAITIAGARPRSSPFTKQCARS